MSEKSIRTHTFSVLILTIYAVDFAQARQYYQHPCQHPLPNDILKGIVPSLQAFGAKKKADISSPTPFEAFVMVARQARSKREGSMGGLGSSIDSRSNPPNNLWRDRVNEWKNTFVEVSGKQK